MKYLLVGFVAAMLLAWAPFAVSQAFAHDDEGGYSIPLPIQRMDRGYHEHSDNDWRGNRNNRWRHEHLRNERRYHDYRYRPHHRHYDEEDYE